MLNLSQITTEESCHIWCFWTGTSVPFLCHAHGTSSLKMHRFIDCTSDLTAQKAFRTCFISQISSEKKQFWYAPWHLQNDQSEGPAAVSAGLHLAETLRFPWPWGTPIAGWCWMVSFRKSHLEIHDDWGYPYFRKCWVFNGDKRCALYWYITNHLMICVCLKLS